MLNRFVKIHYSNKDFNEIYTEIIAKTKNSPSLYIIDQSGIKFTNQENFNTLLNLKQTELETKTNLSQNTISKVENGLGGSLEAFLTLLNFYAKHFNINNILNKDFSIVKESLEQQTSKSYNALALMKLTALEDKIHIKFDEIKEVLKS